jgi:hypothetical protein
MKTPLNSPQRLALVALTLAAFSGLGREARAATAVTPPCGGLERINLYQVTRQKTDAQGQNYLEYSLVPILRNTQPNNVWGAQLSFPTVENQANVKKFKSVPFVLPRHTDLFSIEVATSSVPFNARYKTTPGTQQIPESEYFNAMEQTLCTRLTSLDVLYRASEGAQVKLQRSDNLASWQTLETITYDFILPIVWRPFAWIKNPTNPASGYFRYDVTCDAGVDCDAKMKLFTESQIELRNTYLIQ